jgi:hypothetical protein
MAKKRKLNSKNPKYYDNVEKAKIIKEIVVNNIKGVIIKAIWYEQD